MGSWHPHRQPSGAQALPPHVRQPSGAGAGQAAGRLCGQDSSGQAPLEQLDPMSLACAQCGRPLVAEVGLRADPSPAGVTGWDQGIVVSVGPGRVRPGADWGCVS